MWPQCLPFSFVQSDIWFSWRPSWISQRNDFSNSESPCCPITPGRRQSKRPILILLRNVDQKLIETVFSIAICRQWKQLFLSILIHIHWLLIVFSIAAYPVCQCLLNLTYGLGDVLHCLRRHNTQPIHLSARVHHAQKVKFVLLRGMHYSKHLH